jgi:hypothetical protein
VDVFLNEGVESEEMMASTQKNNLWRDYYYFKQLWQKAL